MDEPTNNDDQEALEENYTDNLEESPGTHGTKENNNKEGTESLYSRLSNSLVTTLAEYGTLGIIFHQLFSFISLVVCYIVVSCGVDVTLLLEYFNVLNSLPTGATTFVIAFVVHKTMTPLRIVVTINCVPFIARCGWYGRVKGWCMGWCKGWMDGGSAEAKDK